MAVFLRSDCFKFGFLAISSRTPATYPDDDIQSRSAAFPTLQVIGGRGSWGPNGRSQSTGVQAVSGFPISQAFIVWLLIRRRRSRQIQPQYHIEKKLLSIDKTLHQRLITRSFVKPKIDYVSDKVCRPVKPAQRTCPITRGIVNYPNYLFLPGVIYPHHTVGAPSFRASCERMGEKYPQLSPLAPFA
jgi:hypothetical protein